MCSIMGMEKRTIPEETLAGYFERTKTRGPDMSRIVPVGEGWLCFHRLAIMDLHEEGMQPFFLGAHALVCNGEIYGFRTYRREMEAKGYAFTSDSDCEVILPLYETYGTDCFQMLGSEFALILYDGKAGKFLAARDPIGIRPLFYGYDAEGRIVFASEAKNLVGLCERIMPFPPGHWYEDGAFHRFQDLTDVTPAAGMTEEEAIRGIHDRLIASIRTRLDADAPLGFLLSGGLDSSLVCAVAARTLGKKIRTFAIGMDTDAIDLKYARQAADFIGAEHTEFYMTKEDVIRALPDVVALLGTWDITTIRASMGMYLCCRAIHEQTDIRVLMTGEISDELFGYKYTDFAPGPEAFQAEAKKRIDELYMYDVLRADRCISVNSLEARVPFGDSAFVRYVMEIPPELKMNHHQMGKYLLRKAFEKDHILPEEILFREKAAFSDAVGHSMVDDLKAYAESIYSDEAYEKRKTRYAYRTPFTKESLLYRELFEHCYPGQAEMIADYWMPNRAWEGCQVDDPSARVLANYGASGK